MSIDVTKTYAVLKSIQTRKSLLELVDEICQQPVDHPWRTGKTAVRGAVAQGVAIWSWAEHERPKEG